MSMQIWAWAFRAGIASLIVVVALAFLVAIGEILNVDGWPFKEGSSTSQIIGGGAMWVFVLLGFALLVPCFKDLYRSDSPASSVARMVWSLFLVLMPFVTPYIYFALLRSMRR